MAVQPCSLPSYVLGLPEAVAGVWLSKATRALPRVKLRVNHPRPGALAQLKLQILIVWSDRLSRAQGCFDRVNELAGGL